MDDKRIQEEQEELPATITDTNDKKNFPIDSIAENNDSEVVDIKRPSPEIGIGAKGVVKLIFNYALLALAIILVFKVVLMINYIPSESMENTIMTGDILVGTRYDVNEESINRYDIMVFKAPDDGKTYFIKRVIGLPGETITVENGKVYADGVELDSSFTVEAMNSLGDGIYKVPEHCYFMMGDNRNNSRDSRFWDNHYVPVENFVSHARFVIYPFTHIKGLEY